MPRVGFEPTNPKVGDFESPAYTGSAIEAWFAKLDLYSFADVCGYFPLCFYGRRGGD